MLSLDVGTSSVTAGGYDSAGRPLPGVQASVRHVPVTTSDGGCELQALELVTRCLRVLRATLDAAAFDDPPSAVGFSCFWHSLIGLDGQGEAITPVFLWADTRSVQQVEYLRRQMDEKSISCPHGMCLSFQLYSCPAALVPTARTRSMVPDKILGILCRLFLPPALRETDYQPFHGFRKRVV